MLIVQRPLILQTSEQSPPWGLISSRTLWPNFQLINPFSEWYGILLCLGFDSPVWGFIGDEDFACFFPSTLTVSFQYPVSRYKFDPDFVNSSLSIYIIISALFTAEPCGKIRSLFFFLSTFLFFCTCSQSLFKVNNCLLFLLSPLTSCLILLLSLTDTRCSLGFVFRPPVWSCPQLAHSCLPRSSLHLPHMGFPGSCIPCRPLSRFILIFVVLIPQKFPEKVRMGVR